MLPLSCPVFFRHTLAEYLTYKIGGPADIFIMPENEEDICQSVDFAHDQKFPITILGNGSNVLIRDKGVRGVVLYLGSLKEFSLIKIREDENEVWIRVPANFSKAHLLDWSLKQALVGLEFSAGIPGTMGGAVYMNAGTKWGSYSEVIDSVEFYSAEKGLFSLPHKEIGFKYRGHAENIFDGKTLILSVDIKLKKAKNLQESRTKVDEILMYRGSRQPLELPNCGSVFKNPENSERGAGRLIEAAGLKGFRVGGAQVSLKHANFILNTGNATSADIENLITHIQSEVKKRFNIALELELVIIGEQ
jgi:UDP-N-acetylmuramate dehydrogenase